MAFSDLQPNQMVDENAASTGGFTAIGPKLSPANRCYTKAEALAAYQLNAAAMDSFASNELVPKSVWSIISKYPLEINHDFVVSDWASTRMIVYENTIPIYDTGAVHGTVVYITPGATIDIRISMQAIAEYSTYEVQFNGVVVNINNSTVLAEVHSFGNTGGTDEDLDFVQNSPARADMSTQVIKPIPPPVGQLVTIPIGYSGNCAINSGSDDFQDARAGTNENMSSYNTVDILVYRNSNSTPGNGVRYRIYRAFMGFDTSGITAMPSEAYVEINFTSPTNANSRFVLVHNRIQHPYNHAWVDSDFTLGLNTVNGAGNTIYSQIVALTSGSEGIVRFYLNGAGLSYINSTNNATFCLMEYDHDYNNQTINDDDPRFMVYERPSPRLVYYKIVN